ncbi:MAG: Gfo/Idh/MocA family oxidoreductase [Lentisphaeria bacterium]|nr:Gfo/Idh/MocA family oxidoreductase [Lentisphaeria bacterium]
MAKKKIGFIDAYIDEWHANNYPSMMAKTSLAEEFEVAFAWEEAPLPDKRPLDVWCKDMAVAPCASIEEVVEKSDCICVLAPSTPEHHEFLADAALRSGKPVFIDKPFCNTAAGAERLFALADRYNTPVTGFSALRFAKPFTDELKNWQNVRPELAIAHGSGVIKGFLNYGIHPLTMLTMFMGGGAKRVMQLNGSGSLRDVMLIEYSDGRKAQLIRTPKSGFELELYGESEVFLRTAGDFFANAIEEMLKFFKTGVSPVDRTEVIEAIRLFEKGITALETPGEWVTL